MEFVLLGVHEVDGVQDAAQRQQAPPERAAVKAKEAVDGRLEADRGGRERTDSVVVVGGVVVVVVVAVFVVGDGRLQLLDGVRPRRGHDEAVLIGRSGHDARD